MFVSGDLGQVFVTADSDSDYVAHEYIERYVYRTGEAPEPVVKVMSRVHAYGALMREMSRLATNGIPFTYLNGQLVWEDESGTNYTYICAI